jgi:hypothetical protein
VGFNDGLDARQIAASVCASVLHFAHLHIGFQRG